MFVGTTLPFGSVRKKFDDVSVAVSISREKVAFTVDVRTTPVALPAGDVEATVGAVCVPFGLAWTSTK